LFALAGSGRRPRARYLLIPAPGFGFLFCGLQCFVGPVLRGRQKVNENQQQIENWKIPVRKQQRGFITLPRIPKHARVA